MSDQPTSVSNDQLAGVSSQTDHLAEVSGELEALQFGKGQTPGITTHVYILALQFCSPVIIIVTTAVDSELTLDFTLDVVAKC